MEGNKAIRTVVRSPEAAGDAARARKRALERMRYRRNLEKSRAKNRSYYARNRERQVARCAAWKKENREHVKAYKRFYYWSHPEFRQRCIERETRKRHLAARNES